jgi:hypothetical protein
MCDKAREELLAQINGELDKRNLKPLKKLGDATKGEIEIAGIADVYDHSARFFYDVKFNVKFPGDKTGQFTIRFNANSKTSDGAVIVVLVNGLFAIVKEWRLPLGRWLHGIPRGFGEKMDAARIHGSLGTMQIGDLPLGTLVRELGEEVMRDAKVTSVTHLGNIAENSGTSAGTPSVFLVQLSVPEDKLNGRLKGSEDLQDLKVELWNTAKVKWELGVRLCDTFSIAAVALALKHFEGLPR